MFRRKPLYFCVWNEQELYLSFHQHFGSLGGTILRWNLSLWINVTLWRHKFWLKLIFIEKSAAQIVVSSSLRYQRIRILLEGIIFFFICICFNANQNILNLIFSSKQNNFIVVTKCFPLKSHFNLNGND